MLESLRKKIHQLPIFAKFIIRLLYPITLYFIFHFGLHKALGLEVQTIQILFLILWSLIEWQLFFKKPQTE